MGNCLCPADPAATQKDRLEEELRGSSEPCVIAFHHPIFDVPFFSGMVPPIFDPGDATRFREIVAGGWVLGVLCGHLHQCMVSEEGGVPYVMSGSGFSELSYSEAERRLYEASGFNFLSYEWGRLTVRPVAFSEGRKLIDKSPR